MATKIKVFKLAPENSDAITQFLQSRVNVLKEGFLISEGMLGILHKEKGDTGIDRTQMTAAISGELSKAQNQYIIQEGLVRAYTAMLELFAGVKKTKSARMDEVNIALGEIDKKFDKDLEKEVTDMRSTLGSLEKKYKTAGKLQKPEIEKESYELSQKLKPLEEKLATHRAEFEKERSVLKTEADMLLGDLANLAGKVKEDTNLLEQAVDSREHSQVFIASSKKLIAAIEAGEIETQMAAL